ncbi:MAG: hypothetical protein II401_11090 [Bacteroidales bacterium]|nr:hypothetical protein [Bacteroidales bacterium]
MNNEDNKPIMEDDGSLAFLNIPPDENSRSMIGEETRQTKILNTTFWVFGFLEDVPTRYSKSKGTKGQTLVQIRPSKDSPESDSQKFFTGSSEILHQLRCIKEMNKFPRRVTLRADGNRYYFE